MNLKPQIVGNIGLYYVCYRLSRLGWNVMPTARNAQGIDVVAYNRSGTKFAGIQVKSLSNRAPVPLGKSLDNIMGDYWIIVNQLNKEPETYILLPEEVKRLAHRGEKEGRVSYWLQPKAYCTEEFFEVWNRINSED